MDARELKVFEAVARHGRMVQAATELNTVQSNVTAQIRRLEEELGVALFERHARGVTLAPPGRRLLPYAKKLAAMVDEARRAALDDGTPQGSLVVGALETTTALRLSPLLNRYVGAHPNVDLSLRTGTTCELVDRVRAGELEGAFVCGPIASSELEVRHAFTEELVLLTGPRLQSLDDLERTTTELRIIVLRAGCSYRQRLEEILARRGYRAGTSAGIRIAGSDTRVRGSRARRHVTAGSARRQCLAGRPSDARAAAARCPSRDSLHSPPRRLLLKRAARLSRCGSDARADRSTPCQPSHGNYSAPIRAHIGARRARRAPCGKRPDRCLFA